MEKQFVVYPTITIKTFEGNIQKYVLEKAIFFYTFRKNL